MYCEKCGTKNEINDKYCCNCGHKLESSPAKTKEKTLSKLKENISSMSKKNKIVMSSVLVITLISIIILSLLLNNPVKKVEDSLEKYYRTNKSTKELVYIGKILKENKEKEKVLNSIKNTVQNITNNWIKNFNKEYKDTESLTSSYEEIKKKVKDIYDYFNGLEYMLDKELYNSYMDELKSLYYSKLAYFEGTKNESEKKDYYAYYYYQKVEKEDCYYKTAQKFINNYLEDELKNLTEEANKIITTNNDSSNEEVLKVYLEQLKYLNSHKSSNNVDLSETAKYQELYNNALNKIIETSKKIIKEYEDNSKYQEAIDFINDTIKSIETIVSEESYQPLLDLKNKLIDLLPKSLLETERTSYIGVTSSNYSKTINGQEYKNNLSINFNEEKSIVVYNLNKNYNTFKSSIILEDIKNNIGTLIISGDNKELYKIAISSSTEIKTELNIDVKNIKEFKIEFIKDQQNSSNNSNIYLVEPYLYK